jgi:hypothetical protein
MVSAEWRGVRAGLVCGVLTPLSCHLQQQKEKRFSNSGAK